MFALRGITAGLLGMAIAAAPAMSQEFNRSEVSVQAFGSFVKSTTDNGIQQQATNSGGVLANYRYFFSASNGVEVNYGYSLNTQTYDLAAGPLGVKSNQHELSAEYVYRHAMRHFTPFAEAGVGALIFDPTDSAGASTQSRAAFVYGGGADVSLSKRVFLRAEYRGLIYNTPTFDLAGAIGADRVTHRAKPSVGFGYRF